ncbi:MAG: DUF167 domain-containing protein [Gemmatimonadetes bacterium]|nr:DUF167 domain-containing protein [Gemmatimonadota bacterium]
MLRLEQRGHAVRFPVRAVPRSSRSELAGRQGDAVKVRLAAPAVEGSANRELVRFLAEVLGVPRSAVRIVSGERARSKVIEVEGIDVAAARRALGG